MANILNNQSYTNKDFQTVYAELIETIGKLNNKWLVNGEGNESDPGVLLLKALASAVDKLNYNIDKNTLENFSSTVQQEVNAREIFGPVYKMQWYISADGTIKINNAGSDAITVPAYMMVSDTDQSVVYTINSSTDTTIAAGKTQEFPVIQGKIATVSINGNTTVTVDNLVDNKIYFDDYAVAENGIFVFDASTTNEPGWHQVDNIYTQNWTSSDTYQGKYYEFDIDVMTQKPFIRFVDDIADKIGSGIIVKYIISSGEDGNISANTINSVYATDQDTLFDTSTVSITNELSIGNGENPESIEDGRKKYNKAINICETLVSLNDYANALYLNDELVSNCFVTDKDNDIQTAYKIHTTLGDEVGRDTTTSVAMTAFDIKLYALTPADITNGVLSTYDDETKQYMYWVNYNLGYELQNPTDIVSEDILNYISEFKHINHNFKTIKNANRICMIQDGYELKLALLFNQQLTSEQIKSVKYNVQRELFEQLNAHNMEWGTKVTYSDIQSIILNTDSRIVGCSITGLDDVDFNAYAIYWTPYVTMPTTDTIPTITSGIDDGYRVVVINSSTPDGVVYTKAGSSWTQGSAPQAVADFKTAVSGNYTGISIAGSEQSWNEYWFTTPTTSVKVCTTTPKQAPATVSTDSPVYQVVVSQYSGATPSSPITTYTRLPTTPMSMDVSEFASGVYYIQGKYYTISLVTSNSKAYGWKWEYPKSYYSQNTTTGSFQSMKISSEIIDGAYDSNMAISASSGLKGDFQKEIFAKSILAGKTPLIDNTDGFVPTVRDLNANMVDGVKYVKTNTSRTFQIGQQHTLDNNEYVQILTPSFTDVATYTFYIWAGFYRTSGSTNLTLRKGESYQLATGEFLIFYHRDSDDDYYTYEMYGPGAIVYADTNMTIYAGLSVNTSIYQGITAQRVLTSDDYVNGVSGTCTAAQQSLVVAATQTSTASTSRLTSTGTTNSVIMRKVKSSSITSATWQTHTLALGKYVLFSNVANNTTATYVLEDGEYLYTWDSDDVETIYSSGSIITFTNTTGSTVSLVSDGVEKQYISGLSAQSSNIVQFGIGSIVKINTSASGVTELSLTSSFTSFNGYSISYYEDSEWQSVDTSSVSGYTTRARCVYRIDTSEGTYTLTYPQQIDLCGVNGQTIVSITSQENNPYYITTDKSVGIFGKTNSLQSETQFYIAQKATNTTGVKYNDSTTTLTIPVGTTGLTVNVPTLTIGDGYILNLSLSTTNVATFSVVNASTSAVLQTIYGNNIQATSATDVKSSYAIKVPSGVSQIKLLVTRSDAGTSVIGVLANSILPYIIPDELANYATPILTTMGTLDPDNTFDFINAQGDEIVNPLAASSFNNASHPYNQFTINRCMGLEWAQ